MFTPIHIFLDFQIRPVRSRYVSLDLCMYFFHLPFIYEAPEVLGIVAGFNRHAEYVLHTSLGQVSIVGKLFPHKEFVHDLPKTLTNHDRLFIRREFKSPQS